MKTLGDARKLAENMVAIGKACGRNVRAVLSNMDVPLGMAIGNALEVQEAAEILQGPRMRRSARRVHDAGSQHGRALQRLG